MKKVLIVDDSALMRRVLSDIISSDERLSVEATASNGLDALDLVIANPKLFDAVILDINMPKMNGIEFLEQAEKSRLKLKVIVVSTVAREGTEETIRCLELGAFDFITKPDSFIEAKGDSFKQKILHCIAAATGLRSEERLVVKSEKNATEKKKEIYIPVKASELHVNKQEYKAVGKNAKKLVALACSTGGPKALQKVIPYLPPDLNAPVLLVQHMPEGFTKSLAVRLNELSKIQVKEAEQGDVIKKGVVYIAKGGSQLRLIKENNKYQLQVQVEEARNGLKPCADIMYESLLDSDFDEITCVVLTGMGADGTLGINQLNESKKNLYVISQNKETCTVYGMPKVLADTGLCNEVVPLEEIANAITRIVGVQ